VWPERPFFSPQRVSCTASGLKGIARSGLAPPLIFLVHWTHRRRFFFLFGAFPARPDYIPFSFTPADSTGNPASRRSCLLLSGSRRPGWHSRALPSLGCTSEGCPLFLFSGRSPAGNPPIFSCGPCQQRNAFPSPRNLDGSSSFPTRRTIFFPRAGRQGDYFSCLFFFDRDRVEDSDGPPPPEAQSSFSCTPHSDLMMFCLFFPSSLRESSFSCVGIDVDRCPFRPRPRRLPLLVIVQSLPLLEAKSPVLFLN